LDFGAVLAAGVAAKACALQVAVGLDAGLPAGVALGDVPLVAGGLACGQQVVVVQDDAQLVGVALGDVQQVAQRLVGMLAVGVAQPLAVELAAEDQQAPLLLMVQLAVAATKATRMKAMDQQLATGQLPDASWALTMKMVQPAAIVLYREQRQAVVTSAPVAKHELAE
jgi:hypothetical protein